MTPRPALPRLDVGAAPCGACDAPTGRTMVARRMASHGVTYDYPLCERCAGAGRMPYRCAGCGRPTEMPPYVAEYDRAHRPRRVLYVSACPECAGDVWANAPELPEAVA